MLMQLKLRGVLDQIKGLVFGYCLESDNPQVVGNALQPLGIQAKSVLKGIKFLQHTISAVPVYFSLPLSEMPSNRYTTPQTQRVND